VPVVPNPVHDSSVFIPVPEAESVVGPWRAGYDRTEPLGFPSHITLLYPFLPPGKLDTCVEDNLARFAASTPPFEFDLTGVCAFRDVIWLAPEPADVFMGLTRRLRALYPGLVPYGDATRTVPPHLTVARSDDQGFLSKVTEQLVLQLPLRCRAQEIWLLAEGTPTWQVRSRCGLGRLDARGPEPGRTVVGLAPPAGGL
jgi:2'-5' RNA ligase